MRKLTTFAIGAVVGSVVVLVAVLLLAIYWKDNRIESEIRNRERILGINCNASATRSKELVERHTAEIVGAVRSNKYEDNGPVPLPLKSGVQVALKAELAALLRTARECEKLQRYAQGSKVRFEGDFAKLSNNLYTLDILMISPIGPQSADRRAVWLKMASQAEEMQRDLTLGATDRPLAGR